MNEALFRDLIRKVAGLEAELDALVKPEVLAATGLHTILNNPLHTDTANHVVVAGDLIYGDATPQWNALAHPGAANHILVSTAALVAWSTATFPTTPVARGSILRSDNTPAWVEYAHPGGAGYALTTDANDVVWDQTPTWTGLHTFNAGWILSGSTGALDGNDLIIDTDGDSYLHAAGDDHVEFVLATASGQLDININGADDFTFTANSFNVLSGSYITMADDTWIGLGAAAGRFVFDSTPAPDQIDVQNADLNFVTSAHGIIHVDGVAAGELLRANGTRYVPTGWFLNGTAAQTYTLSTTGGTVPTGSGANTRVTFWTGADTLSSDAGLTYNAGANTLTIGTGGDIDPADASGQDLGDATHRWDLYTQEVYFGGATGTNVIQVPDNVADALHIDDAGHSFWSVFGYRDAGYR